ncbi:MAG: 3'-5' exonuclease [Rhodanobacteraceae bacterium]|nr:3'-5' exonuclease [Rhodanobacteraceae bacterium]
MKRGLLPASDFYPGEHVRVGDATRIVKRGPEGSAFTKQGSPSLSQFVVNPMSPRVWTARPSMALSEAMEPAWTEPWRYQRWAITDTETTGVGPDARIVELAIVWMRFGVVEDAWSSLVNPGVTIPDDAVSVHGITNEMVAKAPTLQDLLPEIDTRLSDAAIVAGYNIYGYDEPVMLGHGITSRRPIIDALPLLRQHGISAWDGTPARYWKSESERREREEDDDFDPRAISWRRVGRHSLERAARELRVDDPEEGLESTLHRATWDAVLTGRVLWELRAWLNTSDPLVAERHLREQHARDQASMEVFLAQKRAEEKARRKPPEVKLAEALALLREAMYEQDAFEAWRSGREK